MVLQRFMRSRFMIGIAVGILLDLLVMPALQAAPHSDLVPNHELVVDPGAVTGLDSTIIAYQEQLYFELFAQASTMADWVYLLDAPASGPGPITGQNRAGQALTFTVGSSDAIPVDLGQLTPEEAQWAIDHQFAAWDVSGTISTTLHARDVEAIAYSLLDNDGVQRDLAAIVWDAGFYDLPGLPPPPTPTSGTRDDLPIGGCQPTISPGFEEPCDECRWERDEAERLAECEADECVKDLQAAFLAAGGAAIDSYWAQVAAAREATRLAIKGVLSGLVVTLVGVWTLSLIPGSFLVGMAVVAVVGIVAGISAIYHVASEKKQLQIALDALQQQLNAQLDALADQLAEDLLDCDADYVQAMQQAADEFAACSALFGCGG